MNAPASNTIKVMLVDDNPDYRSVVELAFADEDDIDLISQFGTLEIAIRSFYQSRQEKYSGLDFA